MGATDPDLLQRLAQWDSIAAEDGAYAVQRVARVQSVDADGAIGVDEGDGARRLARAASCIVEPEAGDLVAWLDLGAGGYVTAVLVRAAATPQRWRSGAVAWQADSVRLETDALTVRTRTATLVYDAAESIGRALALTVQSLQVAGAQLTTVFDRVTQFARHQQRTVEGVDRSDAGTVDMHAKTLMHLQAENVLANGERLLKVKGAQIHLG